MKRFVYAAAAIVLTVVLVLLAMAIAQRDARVSIDSSIETQLPYANQPAQPIAGLNEDFAQSGEWPPAPHIRGNDSGLPGRFPSEPAESSASFASYTQAAADGAPGNPSTPSQNRRLAEPPPLMNKFLTPSSSSIANSSGPASSNLRPSPSASLSDTLPAGLPSSLPSTLPSAALPNTLPSGSTGNLPAMPSSISDYPGNLPTNPSANFPSSAPISDPSSGSIATLGSPSNMPSPKLPAGNESFGAPALSSNTPSTPSLDNSPAPFASAPYLPTTNSASNSFSNAAEQTPVATLGMPMPTDAPVNGSTRASRSIGDSAPAIPYSPSPAANSVLPKEELRTNMPAASPLPSSSYAPTISEQPLNSFAGANATTPKGTGFASPAPGVRQLDGAQNPSMEIQKRAPNEVQVGVPATFTVLVRNVGNASAFDVNVVDAVPKGARLVRTNPQAQQNGANGLTWKLGEMAAGAEQTITIELVPETEGEIGSVASVNFAAQASVRTISTQPKLVVKQLLEPTVLGGESIKIMIEVANQGTGTARNVRLEEDVPQNMRHASGAQVLGLPVGDLAPGESQKYSIDLTAVSAGKVTNLLRAVADNATSNESAAAIEVVSPKLQVALEGPKLRYLERQATYTASITNTGTAIATNVDLILYLPSGLQFNSAENRGEYVPNQHAVMWQLAELAAGQTASTKVTLLPVEEGDFVLRTQSTADSVRAEPIEKPVRVEGQSELAFSIEDDNDPIETDGKTTYIIKIVNTGTRVDNEVQLQIDLPDGAVVEQVDAPMNYQVSQRAIQFAPIAQMKSKEQQAIRVAVKHTREGTHVMRAQLKSKLRPGAVIKEESTQVYRDQ